MPRSFQSPDSIVASNRIKRGKRTPGQKDYSTVSTNGGPRRITSVQGTPTTSQPTKLKKARRQSASVLSSLKKVRAARAAQVPDVASLDPHQDRVLDTILDTARKRGEGKRAELSATETGLVESSLRNLDYGDADSQGWRQERSSIYGSGKKGPRNVKASTNRFFDELKTQGAGASTPGRAAQAAQGSAFPERYDQEEPKARSILRDYRSQAKKPPATKKARRVLAKAGVSAKPAKKGTDKPEKRPGPWAGAQKAVLSKVPPSVRAEGRGDKRTPAENAAVGGATASRHLTTNPKSYAADLPPDDDVAKEIARKVGMDSHTGTNQVVKDGYRYTLIWQAPGHDDHIHFDAEWVGEGVPPGTTLGGPSGSSGATGGSLSASGGTSASSPAKKGKAVKTPDKAKALKKLRAGRTETTSPEADIADLERRYGSPVV